jgi:GTP-binding protein
MNKPNTIALLDAKFVAGVSSDAQVPPPSLAEVAFAGRSNVGKSSLLNRLVERRKLVRTGSTPGTTRQLNFFSARTADGIEILLVDLPGYGYAKRAKTETARWGRLIDGYLQHRVTLRSLVLLVDARRGLEQDERDLLAFGAAGTGFQVRPPLVVIPVATKLDKLPVSAQRTALEKLARMTGMHPVGFSALTGQGRDELWARIREALGLPASRASHT